jgi:hypothetical protein
MPSSPFAGVSNAVLIFPNYTSELGEDEDGNPTEVKSTSSGLTVKAFFKKLNQFSASQIRRLPGVDERSQYYQGYAVSPMKLPSTIESGSEAEMKLGSQSGIFIVNAVNEKFGDGGIGTIIQSAAGTHFGGWFLLK